MSAIKALTNQYNNLHSQRVQLEQRVKDAEAREQEAADALAVEEARREGIMVGVVVKAPYYNKKQRMCVVGIKGYGPGKFKVRVALPRKDGKPSSRTILYRREDVESNEARNAG